MERSTNLAYLASLAKFARDAKTDLPADATPAHRAMVIRRADETDTASRRAHLEHVRSSGQMMVRS